MIDGARRTVLVIGGGRYLDQNITDILKRVGFEVIVTVANSSTISLALAYCPDLVIVDTRAGLVCSEICKDIRATPELRDTPVVVLSDTDSDNERAAAFSAGAIDFLKCPVPTDKFLSLVGRYMNLHRMLQQTELAERLLEVVDKQANSFA